MPLGRGIAELFEAIPERIEVSGHEPTWRVTGASFDAVLAFAREAYGDTTVIAREDRARWWPRVTLTVTTDPTLAAAAPALSTFAADPEPAPPVPAPATRAKRSGRRRSAGGRHAAAAAPQVPAQRTETVDEPLTFGMLDEIFAHQEELRRARLQIPTQRPPAR